MADSILELRKLGINSKKELEDYIKNNFVKRPNLLDEIKEMDKQLLKLDKIIEAAHTVNKYKKVYDAYVKDKKNPIFKNDYSKEIVDYKKALSLLKNNYSKMPNTEVLCRELEKLQEKKNTLMQGYSSSKSEITKPHQIRKRYEKI